MATRAKPMKPGPGEELIGTITPHGIRLTRDTQRAQRAYRERERAEAAAVGRMTWLARVRTPELGRSGPRRAARSVEWRLSWSSDAPFRVHFAVARWTVPTDAAGLAPTPAAPPKTASEATSRRDAAPTLGRRTERVAVGPGERQTPGSSRIAGRALEVDPVEHSGGTCG